MFTGLEEYAVSFLLNLKLLPFFQPVEIDYLFRQADSPRVPDFDYFYPHVITVITFFKGVNIDRQHGSGKIGKNGKRSINETCITVTCVTVIQVAMKFNDREKYTDYKMTFEVLGLEDVEKELDASG